jgi:hypothetical protein
MYKSRRIVRKELINNNFVNGIDNYKFSFIYILNIFGQHIQPISMFILLTLLLEIHSATKFI